MTTDPKRDAALALHRFGMGSRPGAIAALASDPRGALLAEIARPGAGRIENPQLMTSAQAARATYDFRELRRAREIVARRETDRKREETANAMAQDATAPEQTPADKQPNVPQEIFLAEAKARIDAALGAKIGFVERLVWFWSNHFCVSANKVPAMAGAYEREAIRPHVLGRFADLLAAAEGHPAMLFYLDNQASIGPNSVAGINRSRGLNENLAREILELHTLGVRSGYTQDDVTRFAYVLTGWTIVPVANDPERGGEFVFNRRLHEPGVHRVVGKSYPDTGVGQGRAVLADLARHPATATHIAFKLARHFVADQPLPALVERLAKAFRDSDGDLKQVASVLVSSPEAWTPQRTKLKRPSEWIASVLRSVNVPNNNIQRTVQAQGMLGEPLWRPPSPKGYSDEAAGWLDGMAQRLDIANAFATRVGERLAPAELIGEALGALASAETRQAVARAESRQQALVLLTMAPEFQRR